MKRIYINLIFLLFISAEALQAQITLDNSYFPAVGDSISTITLVTEPGQVPITDSGIDQLWDYSQLSGGLPNTIIYSSPETADSISAFPDANLVSIGAGTTFFRVTDTDFEVLGFEGPDPTGFGVNLVSKFEPALSEQKAPLEFLDFDSYSSSSDIAFSADVLPAGLTDSLPFTPDSIRIRINIDRVDLVDAWGTVILPSNNSYETLRQKRIQLTESRLEVKVPILDWVDVTDQFAVGGGGFLGMDTTVTYTHWAQGIKEPIAVLNLDAEEVNVESITYRNEDVMTSAAPAVAEVGYENVYAYPNPAITYAKFDCVNLKPDYYELKIYNILGLEAFRERAYISGNKLFKVDLRDFRKGTYLYSLSDTTGKVITTKRLVVIKP